MLMCIYFLGPSKAEIQKIRQAIAKAKSLEEVERLNKLLQSGQFSLKDKEKRDESKISICIFSYASPPFFW